MSIASTGLSKPEKKRGRGRPRKPITPVDLASLKREPAKVQPLLVRRADARVMLGGVSTTTLVQLEQKGLLHPKRFARGGTVFYDYANVVQVAQSASDV
jgi:hypothetical protein